MPQLSLLHIANNKVRTDLKCSACNLCDCESLKTNCMDGVGSKHPTYMIVGVAPGEKDDGIGEPMTGLNGEKLKMLLRAAKINPNDCYFTNCLKCCPYDKSKNLTNTHFKGCRDYLLEEIRRLRPKVIISSGARAMEWLTGINGVSKLRKRGLPSSLPIGFDILVFPIRQPAALFHTKDSEEYQTLFCSMVEDLTWIRQQVDYGIVHRAGDIQTDYQFARTPADVERFFAEIEDKPVLSMDLETGDTNFEPRLFPQKDCHIISVGWSFGNGIGRALPLYAAGVDSYHFWPDGYVESELLPRLRLVLESKTVFGQNFVSFDQKWIRHDLGIPYCKIDFDTLLAHYLLNEEGGKNGLETLALLYTTMPPWKKMFTLKDTEQMCSYLCRDVDAAWRVRRVVEPQLNELQNWLLHEVLLPLSNILMDAEYRGTRVDLENVDKLDKYIIDKLEDIQNRLHTIDEIKSFEQTKNERFEAGNPNHVRELLRDYYNIPLIVKPGKKLESADKDVLIEIAEKVPVAADILQIRRLSKLKSTYVDGVRASAAYDGRVHTHYKPFTVTGRLASENPNLQNIPREETAGKVLEDGAAMKAIFCADPGCVLLQADYSQIELRVLACLSGDKNMIEAFRSGQDMHKATAAVANGIPIEEVTKAQRNLAKIINFGVPFGMGEETLIRRFMEAGNSEEAARDFLDRHKKGYPDVWRFMADQEFAARNIGFQETPFGRRRRFTEISGREIRQAFNYKIQSAANEITFLSDIRCTRAFKELGLGAKFQLTVHDSITFSVPKEEFWQTATLMKGIMEGISFPWIVVPLVVDMEVGYNWGRTRKVDVPNKKLL